MRFIILIVLFLSGTPTIAQTFNEWFRQKKTQREYLLLQIAKLQVHIENVRKGYQIVKDGLNLVAQIKEGDFSIHQLFFTDLEKIKPAIRQSPRFLAIQQLYLDNKQRCRAMVNDLDTYTYLSGTFKSMIHDYVQATLTSLDNEMQSIRTISTDGGVQMSDEERFRRIDVVYASLLHTKEVLQSDHKSISLYNYRRGKTIRSYERLMDQH